MKIPLEWLKDYIDLKKSPQEIASSFTQLGLLLDKPIQNNVLDLEHRMDRSDWLSITGCARDLAAFEGVEFNFPQLYEQKGKQPESQIPVVVNCGDLVNRFNTRVFRGVKVAESPDWLKNRLEQYGIPSKNNIVDITNYVMVELGQPMHAQDLDKMSKQEIVIRRAKNGEQMTTLLGEEATLDDSMFVLTQNDIPTVVGGVVGGIQTAVDQKTVNIILDAGNYNQNNIRKTSRKLKIQNETVLRYDKFLHPKLTEIAISRATQLILELAGGEYYENYDYYPTPLPTRTQTLTLARTHKVSGMHFEMENVIRILERLGYQVLNRQPDFIELEIPFFRTDIEVEDDIVSDILRISDYANIEPEPITSAPPQDITSKLYKFSEQVRDNMIRLGGHEHITDPIVEYNTNNTAQIPLENALNAEKSALRTTIYETLINVTEYYKKHKIPNFLLFEIGKFYKITTVSGDFEETEALECIYVDSGSDYSKTNKYIKTVLTTLLNNLGVLNYQLEQQEGKAKIMYENAQIGELRLDSFTLELAKLLALPKNFDRVVPEMQNTTSENLSIVAEVDVPMGKAFQIIRHFDPQITNVEVHEEFLINQNTKSVTFRVTFKDSQSAQQLRPRLVESLKNAGFELRS